MKHNQFVTLAFVILIPALVGSSDCPNDPMSPPFAADINNSWQDVDDATHSFFFQPNVPGSVEQSTFQGSESGPNTGDLTGRFVHENITFTVTRVNGKSTTDIDFEGTILPDKNTMRIHSVPPGEAYTIMRDQGRR